MKILIVSQYFWPENFRINDLALDLIKRGHEVSVLTGKPNYPKGKFYKGYGLFSHSFDNYNGIKVYRVPLFPRGKCSGLQLTLNYLSFVFFSCFFILFHRKKYDISLTFAISPITQVYAALLHKRLYHSKAFLWVQDLWPESISAAGKVKSNWIQYVLTLMVKNIYEKVDKILVSSEAFSIPILKKGINSNKIKYVPNWAEDIFSDHLSVDIKKHKNSIPNGFVVMFAGNIGEAQDFESIIKAAELTKHIDEIKWVIVGDGRKKDWLNIEIERLGLNKTFILLGQYPTAEMSNILAHADITLLTLKDTEIFALTIPSKIQSYMAFGKPILSMANGIVNKIIKEADCGFIAKAGDFAELAKNVITSYNLQKSELGKLGVNANKYYNINFSKKKIIDNLIVLFKN